MGSRGGHRLSAPSRRRLLTWLWGAALITGARPIKAFAATEDPGLPPTVMPDLFGAGAAPVGDPRSYLPKSLVLDRAFADDPGFLIEAAASSAELRWRALLAELSARSAESRIAAVDRFVNSFAWVDDDRLYKQPDYWATPAEFFAAEAGDCEDFAIAKYVGLAQLGFSEERLRVTLVFDRKRRLQHALTIVYWDGDALVLDSLADAPQSHVKVTRYRPICSFNRRQLWVHKAA